MFYFYVALSSGAIARDGEVHIGILNVCLLLNRKAFLQNPVLGVPSEDRTFCMQKDLLLKLYSVFLRFSQ